MKALGSPKIIDMKVVPVAGYDSMLLTLSGAHSPYFTRNIVLLTDNSGNVGLGEIHGGKSITRKLESYKSRVIGREIGDYRNILKDLEKLDIRIENNDGEGLQKLNIKNLQFVVQAKTAIEAALLDLFGKFLNLPVASLLGDGIQRKSIPTLGYLFYIGDKNSTSLNYIDEYPNDDNWYGLRRKEALTTESIVKLAEAAHEEYGFKNFKLKGGVLEGKTEIETCIALKNRFPEVNINIDPNGAWSLKDAINLCKGNKDIFSYVEDPCGPEDGFSGREVMAEFKKHTNLPVATNMIATDWRQLNHSIVLNSLDIPLADPHFWGIRGSVSVAQLCNEFGLTWGSHSNNHFDISLAMFVHTAAAAPGEITAMDTHWIWQDGQRLTKRPYKIKNGQLTLPDKPGLGLDIDMEKLIEANKLYKKLKTVDRDDGIAMQFLIKNWKFDPKRPCLIR